MSPPPPPSPPPERRQSERVELLAQVELRHGDGEVALLPVANISAGGVLLRLEEGVLPAVRVGDAVGVFLDVGDDMTFEVDAEVVRLDVADDPDRPVAVALMWSSADPAFAARLAQALERIASQ